METTTDLKIFDGFNTADPDKLLSKLMELFQTINKATTDKELRYVNSILATTEFVIASRKELEPRLKVIRVACLEHMQHMFYGGKAPLSTWIRNVLLRYGH